MAARVNGEALVLLGALIIAMQSVEYVLDAVRTAAEGRYLVAATYAVLAIGAAFITCSVWRAA